MPTWLKYGITAFGAFTLGATLATKKTSDFVWSLCEDHHVELENARSRGFQGGWEAAVESPTVRLQHYQEFKELQEG
jgi:hypothetical protein